MCSTQRRSCWAGRACVYVLQCEKHRNETHWRHPVRHLRRPRLPVVRLQLVRFPSSRISHFRFSPPIEYSISYTPFFTSPLSRDCVKWIDFLGGPMLACGNYAAVGKESGTTRSSGGVRALPKLLRFTTHHLTGAAPQVSRKPLFAVWVPWPQRELLLELFTPLLTKKPTPLDNPQSKRSAQITGQVPCRISHKSTNAKSLATEVDPRGVTG